MREIKFQFIFQGMPYSSENKDRPFFKKVYTLDKLLEKPLSQFASEYSFSDLIAHRQYTGMKDCEGVEIYEGDVLRGYFGIPPISVTAKVIFSNSSFIVETDRTPRFCNLAEFISHLGGDIEVIGNIYENPELLE